MENFSEKVYLCALNSIFGFQPKVALALISHLGSAGEIFRLPEKDLDMLLGAYPKYRGKICMRAAEDAEKELTRLSRLGIDFLGYTREEYPSLLKECADSPVGIYIRSCTPPDRLWQRRKHIAVVGTRDISPYGMDWCERLVRGMGRTRERPAIVSGLALGTDICAHKTALECGLATIAVMATGAEQVYPYRHREFAERLASTPGCALITDFPPGTSPLRFNFLRRNRIIAGLCDATVLIESKIKGGGMMTSDLAFSYGREVYALPGKADDIRSQGCNELIRSRKAELISSADRLNESLGLKTPDIRSPDTVECALKRLYGNNEDRFRRMNSIILAIRKERGITLDELSVSTGMDYSIVVALASILEADGLIRMDLLQRCFLENKFPDNYA